MEKGFPVPPGLVVSAQACKAFLASAGLQEMLGDLKEKTDGDAVS